MMKLGGAGLRHQGTRCQIAIAHSSRLPSSVFACAPPHHRHLEINQNPFDRTFDANELIKAIRARHLQIFVDFEVKIAT
jgi:hypothetical protein